MLPLSVPNMDPNMLKKDYIGDYIRHNLGSIKFVNLVI